MKKVTIFIALTFTSYLLNSQVIQMDIPVKETDQFNISNDLKSGFHKEPYLIFEGINNQMRIIWQLPDSANCAIFWGTDTTYSQGNEITTEYGDDHQHGHTITGLSPGTKYYYRVDYGSDQFKASFRTAPSNTATDVKFFVYGDTRSDWFRHNNNARAMIDDYTFDPDFQTMSLFTGDHVTYGAAESSWQNHFFTQNATFVRKRLAEVAFIPCLGNHELYTVGYLDMDHETTLFGKYFPFPYVERRYWSFDYGPVHVIVLDQYPNYYEMLPPLGFLDSAQIAWVEEDLNNTDKLWKVAIMHEPGWSCEGLTSGYSHPNNADVQNKLQPLLEEYGVQIVFAAHNHYYARACKNGIFHITTAGGGAPLYEVEEEFPNVMHTHHTYHYCRIEIADTLMHVEAVDTSGVLLDQFTIHRDNRPNHLLGFVTKEMGPGDIEETEVTVNEQSTFADETGYYGLELESGVHEITFTLEGYETIIENSEILEGTETQLDTTLSLSAGFEIDDDAKRRILCWPNPCKDYLSLEIEINNPETIILSINNLTGATVFLQTYEYATAGKFQKTFDVQSLQPGGYYVQLQIGDKKLTKKIIKL